MLPLAIFRCFSYRPAQSQAIFHWIDPDRAARWGHLSLRSLRVEELVIVRCDDRDVAGCSGM